MALTFTTRILRQETKRTTAKGTQKIYIMGLVKVASIRLAPYANEEVEITIRRVQR